MSTLEAPLRMKGRDQARNLADRLPDDLTDCTVELVVPDRALPTASFLDQLLSIVVRDRNGCVEVRTTLSFVRSMVQDSAESLGITERVRLIAP